MSKKGYQTETEQPGVTFKLGRKLLLIKQNTVILAATKRLEKPMHVCVLDSPNNCLP